MAMRQRSKGFTLLELMVVLLILGLGAAVATPAVMRLVESVGRQNQIDQVMLVMQGLPIAAMKQNQSLVLPQTSGYQPASQLFDGSGNGMRWPAETEAALQGALEGARIWLPGNITYRANGACTGGEAHWELAGGARVTLTLKAPVCRPEEA